MSDVETACACPFQSDVLRNDPCGKEFRTVMKPGPDCCANMVSDFRLCGHARACHAKAEAKSHD
jgi:hypothetical protein